MKEIIERFKKSKYDNPLFIGISIYLLLSLVILVFVILSKFNDKNNIYLDPLSGEVIYNPADRTPELYDTGATASYLGFGSLLDRGVSSSSIETLKDILVQFKLGNNEKINEVSIDVKSLKHTMDNNYHYYKFKIRINRKYDFSSQVSIHRSNNTVSVLLKKPSGEIIFNSTNKT